jgi:hypothetical protein
VTFSGDIGRLLFEHPILLFPFYFIALGALAFMNRRFNKPGDRRVIRPGLWYAAIVSVGVSLVLIAFAWLFSEIILDAGFMDLPTTLLILFGISPLFLFYAWSTNKITLDEDKITYAESLRASELREIEFLEITKLELTEKSIIVDYKKDSQARFDRVSYGNLDDLQELLISKLDPSLVEREDNRLVK